MKANEAKKIRDKLCKIENSIFLAIDDSMSPIKVSDPGKLVEAIKDIRELKSEFELRIKPGKK